MGGEKLVRHAIIPFYACRIIVHIIIFTQLNHEGIVGRLNFSLFIFLLVHIDFTDVSSAGWGKGSRRRLLWQSDK